MKDYLNSTMQTENGFIYLNEDWKNAGDDEIIYISEYGLEDLAEGIKDGTLTTDQELVKEGIASTKKSIREDIKEFYPNATDEWIDKHDLVAAVIQSCSWEDAATVIDQMEEWDIWDNYPEN